jgi:glycosyltransferase involved in cell wall biosynthesis
MRNFAPYDDRLPWIPFASGASADLIGSRRVEAIFSTSPFLASHVVALLLNRRYGLPWIADFQDPIRDNPFRTRHWFFPYDAILERLFFHFADRIVANTDTVADAWRARYPKFAHKISVLWNSFDPREEIVRAERPQRSHRVVAHVGTLYGDRHPGRFLAALERLDVMASDIRVKLVGPIEPQLLQHLQPLFDRLTKRGVLEYGNRLVDRLEALRETAVAEYLLLLDLNAKNVAFQMPSKLLDYVRYGKPVLAYTPRNSPVERILAESGLAFVAIDPGESEESEEEKVAAFLRLPVESRPVSLKFKETFSAQTQARIAARLLDELLER